ncbi:CocE/NonD family hydrolase C-terminal non-catalytic domain-containing protein [Actinomadura bangladeshensis]|uniref:CocE/NonD family hydrolase C-terminal non-catalytic domain-containing protein n=1 Tax=Actinomadura bangladeshensis TaxID=453573 RepID=UPI001EF22628|nr:CocE/NonD family hydrolase C-terminal non-catalytic domain-containing protein [Actinomadura bangladeshensis]
MRWIHRGIDDRLSPTRLRSRPVRRRGARRPLPVRHAHLRRDRPGRHQLHPAPLGRRARREAAAHPTGYLKASHRELDGERTTEGNPYHPHTRAVPVEPGTIEEYVLSLYPSAAALRSGHRLVAELSNDEPLTDAHNALLPPDAFHLPVGRPVTHKIYRDASHPSRLVLPFTRRSAVGGTAGA